MPDCSQYDPDTIEWWVCQVEKLLDDNGSILNSNSPPLTGQPKIDFEANADDAADKSGDAQSDSFFSGLSASLVSGPGGQSWQEWFETMSARAFEVVTKASPTQSEKQEALDRLFTIEQKKNVYVAEYT